MRTILAPIAIMLGIMMLLGISQIAHSEAQAPAAAPTRVVLPSPPDTLAGLTPGMSTVNDAVILHGQFSVILPGRASYVIAGIPASSEYQWSIGYTLGRQAFSVETDPLSNVVNLVEVNTYPTLTTSHGLATLMPEEAAWRLYGLPDYAYEWTMFDSPSRELYYMNQGLVVVLDQIPGRSNWTITKLVLTYPAYLRNAVAMRTREALRTGNVLDISQSYRVWARMSVPPAG